MMDRINAFIDCLGLRITMLGIASLPAIFVIRLIVSPMG